MKPGGGVVGQLGAAWGKARGSASKEPIEMAGVGKRP